MARVFLSVLLFALLATSAVIAHGDHGDHSHDSTDSGDVVILTESTFDAEIKESGLTLVEFFAPWCGHCKTLAPNFARAATELKGAAKLASVDCTVEKDLCSRFGVQGFPTLKVFRNSGDIEKPSDYQGGRSDKDIIKYIRKQTEPSYVVLDNDAAIEAFDDKDGVEIIGIFASLEGEDAKAFIAAAEELRNDYTFGITTLESAATKFGTAAPAIVLLKNEAGSEVHVATSAAELSTSAAMKQWIQGEAFELVGEIGPENFQKYLDRGFPLVWAFLDLKPEAAEATKSILDALTEAARQFKGKLSVVKLDGNRWGEHAKHFGLTGSLPGIVIEDRETNKNFIFPEEKTVTAADLIAHFEGFTTGTLKANMKSQAEPADNNGPVKVLVGTTFESIVLDDTKDVLVEFYAPWCGHCKTLAPKYDILGEEFQSDSNIVIAKVDSTENDTPAKVEGFPTIIFYPAGDKKNPITFEGDRSVEAMSAFIKENRKSAPGEAKAAPAAADHTHEEL
jgi:protein disulfide-isomerase A1